MNRQRDAEVPWWRSAVVYQIYPRSFADSDGDGVGDLAGICSRLDYVAGLGVDAIWLSPIYRSPMADFGYDVSDHTAVDPVFGDLRAVDRLLIAAHRRGLRVLLDWVPNHTSSIHPWFLESRSSRDSSKRDWYVWRDGLGDKPPNNWRSAFGGPAWTWDDATGQWYLHLFLTEQPDLNWANEEVVEAMHGVLRFWLDRGVDGFRADVVHLIGKDERLPDRPDELAHLDIVGSYEHPRTHELLRGIRRVLDEYEGERVMVGEVPLRSPAQLVPYYGLEDQLHMVFDFALMHVSWSAEAFSTRSPGSRAGARAARPLALLGSLESRPASTPFALRGLGAARSCGRVGSSYAARDALSLRRGRARPPRCRRSCGGAGGPRRSRRITCADSVGRDARPWLARSSLAALASATRALERRKRGR